MNSLLSFQDQRQFRIQRAVQLSLQKIVLPKDQWVSFEEDKEKGRYLTPYLKEVRKEIKERDNWNNQ